MPDDRSPFEFGRELGASEIADRQPEVRALLEVMREHRRIFLIGPRRFGKTSILRAATEHAEDEGIVVLRYNAEAFPTLARLAQTIVEDATRRLTGSAQRAAQLVQAFFGSLRPQLSFDPLNEQYSITLAAARPEAGEPALLADVLDGLDRLAADSGKPVALVIDEFQRVVEEGGVAAESQIRAAVQRHEHVGYVFAGSKTSMLTEMTEDPARPFYRLGERLFVGPVPREDFEPFIARGFESTGHAIEPAAITEILDLSADVPYNVQRLAHACWNLARDRGEGAPPLSPEDVRRTLDTLVRRDDPFYTQTWNRLVATQQKALLALVELDGEGMYGKDVLDRYGLALSTMRTALEALLKTGVTRLEEKRGSVRHVLEDPFFADWLRLFAVGP